MEEKSVRKLQQENKQLKEELKYTVDVLKELLPVLRKYRNY